MSQVTRVVVWSLRLSHQVLALLSISLVATLSLRLSLSSMSVKVSETRFSQFFATTAFTDPEKISQPSCLASFTNLDNLTPCCDVSCAKVTVGGTKY